MRGLVTSSGRLLRSSFLPRAPPPGAPRTPPPRFAAPAPGAAASSGYLFGRRPLAGGPGVPAPDGFSDSSVVGLRRARHADLATNPAFEPVEGRLESPGLLRDLLARVRPDIVVH